MIVSLGWKGTSHLQRKTEKCNQGYLGYHGSTLGPAEQGSSACKGGQERYVKPLPAVWRGHRLLLREWRRGGAVGQGGARLLHLSTRTRPSLSRSQIAQVQVVFLEACSLLGEF